MQQDTRITQHFTIPVEPVAKARARVVRTAGGGVHSYTPIKTVDAEERIRWHLRAEKAECFDRGLPLMLVVTFHVRKPKSAKKRSHPVGRPDVDNYVKLVKDACNGILWQDDSQVVSLAAVKMYTDGEPEIRMTVGVVE